MLRSLAREDFAESGDRLALDVPAAPVSRMVDPTRMRLLVKNLIDNALCYAPSGGAPVTVALEALPGEVFIRVADRGPGMSPAQVERATEPFYRADPARCRDAGGFGLGLYLCRRIGEAHGGALEIRSQRGLCTEVLVHLPAAAAVSVAA
jgi:signal transduction histidine kinase